MCKKRCEDKLKVPSSREAENEELRKKPGRTVRGTLGLGQRKSQEERARGGAEVRLLKPPPAVQASHLGSTDLCPSGSLQMHQGEQWERA